MSQKNIAGAWDKMKLGRNAAEEVGRKHIKMPS